MPGVHTYIYTDSLSLLFTLTHGPGSWTLQEKEKVSQPMDRCTGRHCRPVLQLPTGQSCSLQTAGPDNKLLALTDDPGAHGNEQMANEAKLDRGQDVEGSGHGRQNGRQAKHSLLNSNCRQHRLLNKATAGNSASGFSTRLRPQTNGWPTVGRLRSKNDSCR